MDTVQFQCGNCGKLMAVSTEHLGSQVHCPHCMEIVEAPPPPAPEITVQMLEESGERESIFGSAEPSDDLFSGSARPLVEMPTAPAREIPPGSRDLHGQATVDPSVSPVPSRPREASATSDVPVSRPEKTVAIEGQAGSHWDATAEVAPGDSAIVPADITRRRSRPSVLLPTLLVFLVPYAIVCTVYIVFVLFFRAQPFDPLERLPDPKPEDGGPKRVKPHSTQRWPHDAPLPDKLKTSLNVPLHIGDVEVTPIKVALRNGDLELYLKMVNTSADLEFTPFHDSFVHYRPDYPRPYTYLDAGTVKLFGGYARWRKGPRDQDEVVGWDEAGKAIGPGRGVFLVLSTLDTDKSRRQVQDILRSQERLTWRVQVRRGLVKVRERDVPATAVIGIEFTSQDISRTGAAASRPSEPHPSS